jgi:integrase
MMDTVAVPSKRGRVASGTVDWRKDKEGRWRWHARITRIDKSRPWVGLDPAIPPNDRNAAKVCAKLTSDYYRRLDLSGELADTLAPLRPIVETVADWFARLHAEKERRGLRTVGEMRGRARKWVLPTLRGKTMKQIAREDIEAIVRILDTAVADFQKHGPGKGRLSPSTAANVWGDLQHALDEACSAKDPALRVLSVNPAKEVRGPEGGMERQGQILYSDELVALLAGVATSVNKLDVPLYRRTCYALAVYSKARSSELEALTVDDVDLVHGTITISKQADRAASATMTKTGRPRQVTRQTKTGRTRTVDIESNLRPLLEELVKHPAGKWRRLLHMPPPEDRAELLRKDLKTVGVTREALFVEHDPLRRSIIFHDLRDTGLTHMAVRGDSPIVIQWAGGHTDFKTTQGYIDRGRVEARRIGAPLPPLPAQVLPKKAAPKSSSSSGDDLQEELTSENNTQELRPQRELKSASDVAPRETPVNRVNPIREGSRRTTRKDAISRRVARWLGHSAEVVHLVAADPDVAESLCAFAV